MNKITSILVPVNFTPVAHNAYRYALHLAEALGADIDLLYVVPPTHANVGYGAFTDHFTVTLQQEARRDLSAFACEGVAEVKDRFIELPRVRTYVRVGELNFGLRQHVEQEGSQLIVMGSSGSRSIWDEWLGTNTSALINRAPCSVLVIPADAQYAPPASICFATDLRYAGAAQARQVLQVMRPLRPHLHFIHIRTADNAHQEFDLDRLRKTLNLPEQDDQLSFTKRTAEDTTGAIFAYAIENKCGMVVMHRPERPWFQQLMHKSNTRAAVLRARLPLLILPAGKMGPTTWTTATADTHRPDAALS